MEKSSKHLRRITWEIPDSSKTRRPRNSNLIFCPSAGRAKLHFETFEKAVNYIRWNSQEIYSESGRAPVRAYWCYRCMCFHVTSRHRGKTPEEYKKDQVKKLLTRSLNENSVFRSRRLLERAKKIIFGLTKDKTKFENRIHLVESELNRREFNQIKD